MRKRLGNAKSKAKSKAKAKAKPAESAGRRTPMSPKPNKSSKGTVSAAAKSSVGGLSAKQAEMRQQNEEIVETLKSSIQMTSDLK